MQVACLYRAAASVNLVRRQIGQQRVVLPHQLVGDRHQLAEHLRRRVRHADVVAGALGHLLDAIQPLEQRRRHHDLRFEAVGRHEVAADVEVEELIGAAELDVSLQEDRVVRLGERVEELVERDRLTGLEALLEVASFEHLRDAVLRREAHPAEAAERLEPLAVEAHLRLLRIEDLEDLRLVGLGVVLDLFRRQRRPRLRAAGRIPDERGEGPTT